MSSSLFRVFICLLGLFAIGLLSSCGDDPCSVDENPVDEAPDYTRETPEMLLSHLAESFDSERADWYAECLDEAFVFVLTDRDAESLGLPEAAPWLERSEDTAAVARMFRDEYTHSISFRFSGALTWEDGDEEGTLFSRTDPDIVVEIECPGAPPIGYWVNATWFEFIVAQDPGNQDLWVIRSMTEIAKNPGLAGSGGPAESGGGTGLGTNPSTLGYIKSIFLKAPATNRTVDEALEAYASSIEAKDIEIYGDCLDFHHRFIFTEDIAAELHLPREAPWWTESEDLEAMTVMFEHPNVATIQFDYSVESRDTSWVKENMIVGIRVRPNILLRYEAPGQEPYTYWVNDGFLDFKVIGRGPCLSRRTVLSVEEIPRTPIREKTIGQKLGRASSWGMIKAWFAIQGPGR